LDRHYDKLKDYARMLLQLRNVVRKREDQEAFKKLKTRAEEIKRDTVSVLAL